SGLNTRKALEKSREIEWTEVGREFFCFVEEAIAKRGICPLKRGSNEETSVLSPGSMTPARKIPPVRLGPTAATTLATPTYAQFFPFPRDTNSNARDRRQCRSRSREFLRRRPRDTGWGSR